MSRNTNIDGTRRQELTAPVLYRRQLHDAPLELEHTWELDEGIRPTIHGPIKPDNRDLPFAA